MMGFNSSPLSYFKIKQFSNTLNVLFSNISQNVRKIVGIFLVELLKTQREINYRSLTPNLLFTCGDSDFFFPALVDK